MNCISIKSKKEPHLPCPHSARIGSDFCGIHARVINAIVFRVPDPDPELDPVPAPATPVAPSKFNLTYPMLVDLTAETIDSKVLERIDSKVLERTAAAYGLSISEDLHDTLNRLRAYLKPIYQTALEASLGCLQKFDYQLCQNQQDFYHLDDLDQIPPHFFFTFRDIKTGIYGCDVRSFQQYLETLKDQKSKDLVPETLLNIYNRQPLEDQTLINYQRKLKFLQEFHPHEALQYQDITENMTPRQKLRFKILEVFQIIYQYDYPVDHLWFSNLNRERLLRFYACLEELWNVRLNLTPQEKHLIVPGDIQLFSRQQFNHLRRQDYIVIQEILINIMEKMVTKGQQVADRKNGAMYLLMALVQVHPAAAESLPFLTFALGY